MWRTLLSAAVWVLLIVVLDRSWPVGDTRIPPPGSFFSPWHGFWQNAGPVSQGMRARTLELNGVQAPVRVVFDERLVPHIYADSDHDAYFAQGYVTAMLRIWQMDISTRATAGELAAVLGKRLIPHDLRQRRLGMGYASENALSGWQQSPESVALLEAYVAGVNAWIDALRPRDYPLEYKLLDFKPKQWTPLRSAVFSKSMAARLCLREEDLEHTNLIQLLGEERYNLLFPLWNPHQDPVIPPGTVWDFDPVDIPAQSSGTEFPPYRGEMGGNLRTAYDDEARGSNNWAVDGSRTASGKPILCGDPHLGITLPAIWLEVQIKTPEQHVHGVSLPSIPGVIIGFNDDIAWSITNAEHDVLDWYTIEWMGDSQTHYILDGEEKATEFRVEHIAVRGSAAICDTVCYTHWGPVQKEGVHKGLAMRWMAHEESHPDEMRVFPGINRAQNFDQFTAALEAFHTPAQNFVFADRNGNIAIIVGGKLPLRISRSGQFVQDGSATANGWQGRIPYAHNPRLMNPSRGFVASANQHTTDPSYPYLYHGFFEAWRGRILNECLSALHKASVQDMMAIQLNNTSLRAREILPPLLAAIDDQLPQEIDQYRTVLNGWNYTYAADATAPVLFELWYRRFAEMVWDDFVDARDSVDLVFPYAWRLVTMVRELPESDEFDIVSTPEPETLADVALASFIEAAQDFNELDDASRTWGAFRPLAIDHLARIPGLGRLVTTASGSPGTLNARGATNGPSWRMIVHLTDPVEAHVIYPGGQSGNPGSPYYDTMIDDWVEGKYYTVQLLNSPEEVTAVKSMTLNPHK